MFCINCGEELPETAYFCLKCGVMTGEGVKTGVSSPHTWDKKVGKTFSKITKDVGNVVDKARENIRKSIKQDPVSCKNCGENNIHQSKFCYNCGKELN